MKLSAYLSLSRHGIFYFRWPLPHTDRDSRPMIRISLRTRCPERAGTLARYLASCGQITKGNKDLARLRQDKLRELVRDYFQTQLDQYLEWINSRGLSSNARKDAEAEMLDHQDHLDSHRLTEMYLPIARFKRKMGVSDADWLDSLPNAVTELRKGRRDMLQRVLEAAERLDHYAYGDEQRAAPSVAYTQVAPAAPPSASLGSAISDFMAEHSREWPDKTTKQVQGYFNILIEHFGEDRALGTITKQDASEVKKILQSLPASRNTIPELKALTLSEVVKVTGHDVLAPKTINAYIAAFRRLFDWAERHGHSPHKLFDGMKVPKAKEGSTERKPFTKSQTRLMFTELTENTSRLIRSESHRWGSLLAMFTGARLNEICQLEIADIQQEDGIWLLHITDEGDDTKKRVKAKASRRKVPIHSELLRLGFLDFVQSRSRGRRLFPDYSFNENGGYGRNLGRWFNETTFLPKLGLKTKGVVFHCLRHTMVTRLGQAGVPEPIIQCVVGHARAGVTQQVYLREGYTVAQLKAAVDSFEV